MVRIGEHRQAATLGFVLSARGTKIRADEAAFLVRPGSQRLLGEMRVLDRFFRNFGPVWPFLAVF